MISTLEKEITFRFLKARKTDGFLNVISIFSFIGISLGVAVLIIVMSVMNGFRTELINKIVGFKEKDQSKTEYINGGFFVINKKILKLIKKDNCIFEKDILPKLVKKDEINAFVHNGFWYAMDTARDNIYLNSLWEKNKAQWKIWKN